MGDSAENTPFSAIDLTADPKDHLTALPSELQHLIISFLFPTHEPEKAFHHDLSRESIVNDCKKNRPASHPLDSLAATSRSLRNEVMTWSRITLTKHRGVTNYKPLKTAKRQMQRNLLRGRGGLLTWSEKNCVFCGKKSARSAVLMNGIRCCAPCDRQQWPDKITKTDAKRQYHLKDHHLLPEREFAPSLAKLLRKHPGGLPKLRYGTYISSGVATTMFLRKDVAALSALAHGDLKAHLDKKQAERDERKRKREEAKLRHQTKWDEMVAKVAELPPLDDSAILRASFAPNLLHSPIDEPDELRMPPDQILGMHGIGMNEDPFMGIHDVSSAFDSILMHGC